jgi:hypothetical protein
VQASAGGSLVPAAWTLMCSGCDAVFTELHGRGILGSSIYETSEDGRGRSTALYLALPVILPVVVLCFRKLPDGPEQYGADYG